VRSRVCVCVCCVSACDCVYMLKVRYDEGVLCYKQIVQKVWFCGRDKAELSILMTDGYVQ